MISCLNDNIVTTYFFIITYRKKAIIRVPLLEIKKAAYSFAEREKRKPSFFAEPEQRHEVKWEMMTMTMTIGMDAGITL